MKLGTKRGQHRFVWDLKHEPPRGAKRQFAIAATYKGTPSGPVGPLVLPGPYIVRLTVDGTTIEKQLIVKMDPRVKTSKEQIEKQSLLSKTCYDGYHQLQEIRDAIDSKSDVSGKVAEFRGPGAPGDPDTMYGSIHQSAIEEETIVSLQHKFLFMLKLLQAADANISTQAVAGVEALQTSLEGMKARWEKLK